MQLLRSYPLFICTPNRTRTCAPGSGGRCSIHLSYGGIKKRLNLHSTAQNLNNILG